MSVVLGVAAIVLVLGATIVVGGMGVRLSRTTGDFFVASRSVRPVWNASAISGEYLSAGTFLGLAGLVLLVGADGFWFPIGYAAGYLLLLLFVAAPLRRSGAYTIPDFIEARLESRAVRRLTSLLVIVIGCLYIVPQLHGASLTLQVVADVPPWVGSIVVAVVVTGLVAAGGMRAITAVQAMHYWVKLIALLVPAVLILIALSGREPSRDPVLAYPVEVGPIATDPYSTTSLMIALLLGTIGLPHVLVRFYTSPDGGSARRTTVLVIGMIGVFYAVSGTMGLIARAAAPDLAQPGLADTVVLALPSRILPGPLGDVVTALVVAGAFAAFLATSSGLVVSLAGVISQDVFDGSVRSFRFSAVLCVLAPLGVALLTGPEALVSSVGTVFLVAATSLTPVILLGVWWRGLTARGSLAGMLVGAVTVGISLLASALLGADAGAIAPLLVQPAAWAIPLVTGVIVLVSRLDKRGAPPRAERYLTRLHLPERQSEQG
ncbi:cation/acetate symporter [Microbacterium sp. W4I4]|uniref:sodium/solute symporter n=1 Tax=Microbacterium sp. W4I4 TaxID=3042295 RepID=UPI00278A73FA|nr:cation acetate symporter [Microbacterium sp. W4I4]MDQ0613821.1 cation/acetate symporter [Microbacterium sp. W4I4]